MSSPVETDIIGMLRHLVYALQAFAQVHEVTLAFQSDRNHLIVSYHPEDIITEVTGLICRVLEYTPSNQSLLLGFAAGHATGKSPWKISLEVTGINLSRAGDITASCKHEVTASFSSPNKSLYEWQLPSVRQDSPATVTNGIPSRPVTQLLPGFYANVRKHLQAHFTKTDPLVAASSSCHPRDAAFMKKINNLISENLDKEGFDANHLSKAMQMSRAQLYRKLQAMIRQTPGCYIRKIRIQKAKELLETTDMRVGEVAYKTGFQTSSHFTRLFIQYYGVKPSLFCRQHKNETNG